MKIHIKRLPKKIISCGEFKKFGNKNSMRELESVISYHVNRSLVSNTDLTFPVCMNALSENVAHK